VGDGLQAGLILGGASSGGDLGAPRMHATCQTLFAERGIPCQYASHRTGAGITDAALEACARAGVADTDSKCGLLAP